MGANGRADARLAAQGGANNIRHRVVSLLISDTPSLQADVGAGVRTEPLAGFGRKAVQPFSPLS